MTGGHRSRACCPARASVGLSGSILSDALVNKHQFNPK